MALIENTLTWRNSDSTEIYRIGSNFILQCVFCSSLQLRCVQVLRGKAEYVGFKSIVSFSFNEYIENLYLILSYEHQRYDICKVLSTMLGTFSVFNTW